MFTVALVLIVLGFQIVGFLLGWVVCAGFSRGRDPWLVIERRGARTMCSPLSHLALLAALENDSALTLLGPVDATGYGALPEDPTLRVYLTKAEPS
jgi:hypothetical protein